MCVDTLASSRVESAIYVVRALWQGVSGTAALLNASLASATQPAKSCAASQAQESLSPRCSRGQRRGARIATALWQDGTHGRTPPAPRRARVYSRSVEVSIRAPWPTRAVSPLLEAAEFLAGEGRGVYWSFVEAIGDGFGDASTKEKIRQASSASTPTIR